MGEHRGIEELSIDECLELLATQSLGRVGFQRDDRVEILPLNYHFADGAVYVRTGWGALVDAVHRQHVAFEIDGGSRERREGWSVVVHGIAEEIWHGEELERARQLPLDPWAPGDRDHFVRISPTSITGRRIR